jgi:uncharacterized membrane protein (UPF0182 family)
MLVTGALVALLVLVSEIWTEVLWFGQVGYENVWTTRLAWQLLLFVGGAVILGGAVAASLTWAYRSRPLYAPATDENSSLERYRSGLDPMRRLVVIALPIGLGLFAGSAAAQQWQQVLLFINGGSFGRKDPQFGMDAGFYVFKLPFLQFAVGYLLAVLVLALLAGAVTHYLYGGLRLTGPGERSTPAARRHLGGLGVAILLIQAGSYWLDRYALLVQQSPAEYTGASYTGVQALAPAKTILAMLAVIVALTFVLPMVTGSWRLPTTSVVLMLIASIVVGGVYPNLVQQFQVRPSAQQKEAPYIRRHIEATRFAYGVDRSKTIPYAPSNTPTASALNVDAQTTASIRLLDPALVGPAFTQLQNGQKAYYSFAKALDVDRYTFNGQSHDTVIAVRELNLDGLQSPNWVNQHINYTHGYGVVAAYGNQSEANGDPLFYQRDIPSSGPLGEYEERIYFGEQSTTFSIVGAPPGSEPQEIDYPRGASPTDVANTPPAGQDGQTPTPTGTAPAPADPREDSAVVYNTFAGDGGPRIGGFLTRLLYSIKFRDQNILLSGGVNSESQILYDRTPRQRVEKVAPFLTLDGDPYPAVVNGRVLWIVDGYTTSNSFPYSQRQVLGEATTDTLTLNTQVQAVQGEINYLRNSVKATVDAYDGTVTLYAWDDDDPILAAWQKTFPGAVKPMSKIDGELMSHLRYPEDLFKVQRDILGRYHTTDPNTWFSGLDWWETPPDPTADVQKKPKQPPYYLTLQMPEQASPAFSLTSTYIPRSGTDEGANVLTGFLAVDASAGNQTGIRADTYGTLRLLRLPEKSVPGPGQIQSQFTSSDQVQNGPEGLRLLDVKPSKVEMGNLLTLPVAGGLLYVQPAYVSSTQGTSYPRLRKVIVSFGQNAIIGYDSTLEGALDQVFGSGGPSTEPTGQSPPTDAGTRLDQALADASAAIQEGNTALSQGDFAGYGVAQAKLKAAIESATQARADLAAAGGGTGTDGATPTESPPPTP